VVKVTSEELSRVQNYEDLRNLDSSLPPLEDIVFVATTEQNQERLTIALGKKVILVDQSTNAQDIINQVTQRVRAKQTRLTGREQAPVAGSGLEAAYEASGQQAEDTANSILAEMLLEDHHY
jgi:hypothetical protein